MSFNHEIANDTFIDVKEEKEINKASARRYINDYLNTSEALPQTDKLKAIFPDGALRCWLLDARYWINTKIFLNIRTPDLGIRFSEGRE